MSRILGTFKNAREWAVKPNPNYAGVTPRLLEAECHDRTPFLAVECDCGYQLHLHESQIAAAPPDAEIASRCHGCGAPLIFPPGYFQETFQAMRDEGWIA